MEIPKKSYACAHCHQRFSNPSILIKHVELRHSIAKQSQNGVLNTEPEEINTRIQNRDPLENTSTRASQIIVVNPFEFCGPISNSMEMDPLQVSIKDKYEEINNQVIKSEKNKENYAVHKYTTSIHEGKKVYKCNMCDKNSIWKHAMKQHMASVHEGKKPFKCGLCDYSSSRKDTMKGHMVSVHECMKPSKCDICGHRFSKKVT